MKDRKTQWTIACFILFCCCAAVYMPATTLRAEQTVDGVTCATQTWLTGRYSGFEPGDGLMPNQMIKEEIEEYVGGKKENKIVMLATSYNGYPVATPAEYTLDSDTMTFYGIHETDTEKLLQIERNPKVSISLHEKFTDFESQIKSQQFKGTAVIIEGSDPEFEQILADILPFEEEYGSYFPDMSPEDLMQLLKMATVLTKITLEEATIADTLFKEKGYRTYQRWTRGLKLLSFTATSGNDKVILDWTTDAEIDVAGFNVYRSSNDSEYQLINSSLITATGSETAGDAYQYIDTTAQNLTEYSYMVASVDSSGNESLNGPVTAAPNWFYWLFGL